MPKKNAQAKEKSKTNSNEIELLKKQNLELTKKLNTLISNQEKLKTKSDIADMVPNLKDQLNALVAENKKLLKRASKAESSAKFVGVRSTCDGDIWLPAPEAGSGMPEDANKGIFLKSGKTAVIPNYWMAYYIANRNKTFLSGFAVMDNNAGGVISPGVLFDDIELPDEFIAAAAMPKEIKTVFDSGSTEKITTYIDSIAKNELALSKVYAYAKSLESKYQGKHLTSINAIIAYIEEIIFNKSEDKG